VQSEPAHEETTFSLSNRAPQPSERRRESRHMTILRVGTLIADGRRELCLIRNISAGGVMAHAYSRLAEGQRVAIELQMNQRIEGEVNWIRGSNIGVAFDAPIDVEAMLNGNAVLHNGWRPRLPRVEIDRMGGIRSGAVTHWVTALDISQGGLKVETDRLFADGEPVVVTLDGLRPIAGLVRWCHDGQCGIGFNQVIPFRELMDWLRAA